MGILFDFTRKREIIHELANAVEELAQKEDKKLQDLIREAKEIASISIEHYECEPKGYTLLELKLLNMIQGFVGDCECIEDSPEGNKDLVNGYYEKWKEDETIQFALEQMRKAQGKGRGVSEN